MPAEEERTEPLYPEGYETLDAWLLRRYHEELGGQDFLSTGTWARLYQEYTLTYPAQPFRYKTANDLRHRRKGIQRVITKREKAMQMRAVQSN